MLHGSDGGTVCAGGLHELRGAVTLRTDLTGTGGLRLIRPEIPCGGRLFVAYSIRCLESSSPHLPSYSGFDKRNLSELGTGPVVQYRVGDNDIVLQKQGNQIIQYPI